MSILHNCNKTGDMSPYQASLIGDGTLVERQAWDDEACKEYVVPLFPEGTFLRRDALLDINSYSDITLELTPLAASVALYSPANHTGCSWSASEVEILCSYI